MSNFKYHRDGDTFIWESDFMILEYSEPKVQGYSSHIHIKDINEIMYFYYTVKLYKKVQSCDFKGNRTINKKFLAGRYVHDFPCIAQLKDIIEYQLEDDTKNGGQKIEYVNGNIAYSKTLSTEGFACEDFYELTKIVNEDSSDKRFIFYVGLTYDIQGDLNSAGIRTPYINRSDIKELYNCISDFANYAIDYYNKMIDIASESYKIKSGKIYEYSYDDNGVSYTTIESIYVPGDIIDVDIVLNNEEHSYENMHLVKINDNILFFEDGTEIDFNTVAYIDNNPTKEMLQYKEDDIAIDFLNILNKQEKAEFMKSSTSDILFKYSDAIINRTAMCRDEHGFNMDYELGDRVDNVMPIVEIVIEKIKDHLSNT